MENYAGQEDINRLLHAKIYISFSSAHLAVPIRELEISQDVLRRRVRAARRILQWNFKIELDVPELFPSARNTNRHM